VSSISVICFKLQMEDCQGGYADSLKPPKPNLGFSYSGHV